MATVSVLNMEGKEVGTMELSDAIFGAKINEHLVHMAVVQQLANNRQGTQSARTRSEVRGGGTEADRERYRRNQAKNIKRCMSKISEESGCEITPERLFVSGFLEFVRKKCIEEGRDHVFFVQIFRCAYETKYHKIIEIYAKEYGMPGKIYSEKLRLRCYPYVIRDKRMFEKTVDR